MTMSNNEEEKETLELVTFAQVKQFVDAVYLLSKPYNADMYNEEVVRTVEIFDVVKTYTTVFQEKSNQAFACWCRENRLDFLQAKQTKKSLIARKLFVLKEEYHENLVRTISLTFPRWQRNLKNLKAEDVEIVGYVRKSPTNDDERTRTRLLKKMIVNLRERSFADKIFISESSKASSTFASRDLSSIDISRFNADGNTQSMLSYLHSAERDICLVSTDFAGLTSRSSNIVELIRQNPRLKYIAIETFATKNDLYIFNTSNLINSADDLKKFDERTQFYRRSA